MQMYMYMYMHMYVRTYTLLCSTLLYSSQLQSGLLLPYVAILDFVLLLLVHSLFPRDILETAPASTQFRILSTTPTRH